MTHEGTIALREGAARVAPAPEVLLGTLWLAAGERRIDLVRALSEDVVVQSETMSIADLVDANAGENRRACASTIREYVGKLLEAPAQLALLEFEGKVHAFRRDWVKAATFAGLPSLKGPHRESRTALSIHAAGGDGSCPQFRSNSDRRLAATRKFRPTAPVSLGVGQHASKPLPLESPSKHVHAPMMTAAEARSATTAAGPLVSNPFSQRRESHEIDREFAVIHTKKRCEIFAETGHSVVQLTEGQNAMAFEERMAVQRRNDALLDVGKKRFAVDDSQPKRCWRTET